MPRLPRFELVGTSSQREYLLDSSDADTTFIFILRHMVMPQPLTKKQWLMASLNLAIDQEPDVRLSFRHQFILSRHE